jgi:hypothetical protein
VDVEELLELMDDDGYERGAFSTGFNPWKRTVWTELDEQRSQMFLRECEWCGEEFWSKCSTAHFCRDNHKFNVGDARRNGTWVEKRPKLYRDLTNANLANPNHQRRTG